MATYNTLDSSQLKRENLINNDDFINDASQFLAEREDYYSDDVEDIYDRYLEHFRYQNVNEVTAARDMYHAQNLQTHLHLFLLQQTTQLLDQLAHS